DLEIEDFIDENVIKSNRNSGHLFAIYSLPMGLSIGLEYEFVKDTIDIAELEDPDTVQRETYSYTFDRLHPAIMWRGPGFDVGLVHSTKVKIISEKVTE